MSSWDAFKKVFEERFGLDAELCCREGCDKPAADDQFACKEHVIWLRAYTRMHVIPSLAMLDFLQWCGELPVDLRKWPEDA